MRVYARLCGAMWGYAGLCVAMRCYAGYAVLCGALLLILGLCGIPNTLNILVYETIFLGSNDFCKRMFVL